VATALGENPTLGVTVDRAELTGKKYVPPKQSGTGGDWKVILTLRITVEGGNLLQPPSRGEPSPLCGLVEYTVAAGKGIKMLVNGRDCLIVIKTQYRELCHIVKKRFGKRYRF
jgi:hypothetical protein